MTQSQPFWDISQVLQFFEMPFIELLHKASSAHLQFHPADEMELCSLLSVKTGACPEDCAYCPQSGHYPTGIAKENLLPLSFVVASAKAAKARGAKRYCMGAAWRNPPRKDFPKIIEMIKAVKEIGLETCVTLGMLNDEQACELKAAGLDFYNHNLDSSPEYYEKIIHTRTYSDRLETLSRVRANGIQVCCGGIIGMGETRRDRAELLVQLANLPAPPKSIPINRLIPVKGTPLAHAEIIDNIEFIRTIAAARIMMPESIIRLSAGRETMSEEMQTLCFCAGANSIWLGEKLLTAKNSEPSRDQALLQKLGFKTQHQHD
ncbi:Biotin synthase [Aquicella siphonis]|uniref:Biotin synthase n=1 Tax=Aquicella siphonis TaxID=254247 RepID=A0A5E4PIM0_9COXI|nr:biotin synthase BioB [Aquicella siphonis]VVC76794.1 Biotin synthase [Aquicella siphonis]